MAVEGRADLAEVLSGVARSLQSEDSMGETLEAIARAAVTTVPGVDHAGVSLARRPPAIETVASSDDLVVAADHLQNETGEGPCMDAAWKHDTFRVDDLTTDTRWPAFGPRAVELGIRSMLSFQLYVEADNLGALNLYSRRASAFDDDAVHVGKLFAAHAAVAFVGSRREQQLSDALTTRDLIGTAKGILMERHHVPNEHAFRMLIKASQDSNIKLRDVADYLVRQAELAAARRRGDPGTRPEDPEGRPRRHPV